MTETERRNVFLSEIRHAYLTAFDIVGPAINLYQLSEFTSSRLKDKDDFIAARLEIPIEQIRDLFYVDTDGKSHPEEDDTIDSEEGKMAYQLLHYLFDYHVPGRQESLLHPIFVEVEINHDKGVFLLGMNPYMLVYFDTMEARYESICENKAQLN